MREEFLHMENKNAGYIWHPVWHIIPGLKNTKQNLKNSKLKKKKLARFQFYRNVFSHQRYERKYENMIKQYGKGNGCPYKQTILS